MTTLVFLLVGFCLVLVLPVDLAGVMCIEKRFSNLSRRQNHPEDLLKHESPLPLSPPSF